MQTRTMLISERETFLAFSLRTILDRLLKLDPKAVHYDDVKEAEELLRFEEPLSHHD